MDSWRIRASQLELVGFAAASVILYRLELFSLIFLVPIQLAWIRHGESGGVVSSGLAAVALVVTGVVEMSRFAGESNGAAAFLGPAVALALLLGLFFLNSPTLPEFFGRRLRVSERAGLAAVSAGVVFGLFAIFLGRGLWSDFVGLLLVRSSELIGQVEASPDEIGALAAQALQIVARGALASYLFLLLGSWWAGSLIAFRTRFPLPGGNPVMEAIAGYSLSRFSVPVNWVWILIVGWGGVVVATLAELPLPGILAWNVALAAMVVYAVQGAAILIFLIGRRGGGQRLRLVLAGGFVLGLLIPGLRVAIAVGIPVLGVSEIWVTYHRFEGSEDTDESHS